MIADNDNLTAGPYTAETSIAAMTVACVSAGTFSDDERPICPRCRQKTDLLETIYVERQPRNLCGNCVDFLKTQPRPRPTRHRLPDRAIAPQINRRLMPCNRLGPDATFGRKAT